MTAGVLAMVNLQAQIDGLERQARVQRSASIAAEAGLVELVALRGHVLGRIADYEWADERANGLTHEAPTESAAFLARARSRGRFHRFTDAVADLDTAARLDADPAAVEAERAAVYQAVGSYEQALSIYRAAAKHRADFESLGALATLHAERGEIANAERLFDESRRRYRGVSPLPLALLDLRRGHMWLTQLEFHRALMWFESAVRILPAYAPAQGHLAVVESTLGDVETAIARLRPLTTSSDDPEYTASLARVLLKAGRPEEAAVCCEDAAARYDELLARHPEAFADHAAEYWLDVGDDPVRALRLAKLNFDLRPTVRAQRLLARAVRQGAGYEE